MKIHAGCGSVYLDGYINIDLDIKGHYLAKERPDIVEKNKTTLEKYYKDNVTSKDFMAGTFQGREVVCDVFGDVTDLQVSNGIAEEILAVQLFEHFTFADGEKLLKHWQKKLIHGGKLHLDVPDLDGNIELYNNAKEQDDKDWVIRLLMGSQKNEWGVHKAVYTQETLKRLLAKCGYVNIKLNSIIRHSYPAFGMDAYKTRGGRDSNFYNRK